ncbi:uncharacterized protein LOC116311232 isoform X1 [Oreochromis aureus]|uniref:uncharacterized protein LOC116311232 isoform X1 n=1 Tax=Oreochromis aureus TaxID=47969 RepID=UPI00195437B8|nr:uncharacterized protein LOC116311232 isoform X1 [Oreochromis aureus]
MKITQFLLLCILGATLLSAVNCNNANGPDNCCFKLYPGRIKANLIKSYQLTDDRCPKSAVIHSKPLNGYPEVPLRKVPSLHTAPWALDWLPTASWVKCRE